MDDFIDPSPSDRLPAVARKGRGAVTNRTPRFETEVRERVYDGWSSPFEDEEGEPPSLLTSVTDDATRTIIATNESPDIPFDQSINPYRGCEHGCVYCFARPSHAYLGLSPGLDFETRLLAKPRAAELLDRELRHKSYRCKVIALGTNTDPYQPIERERRITRQILEVLAAFNHPVTIVTKSALVTRDIDILAPMAARGLARVALSVTTLDRALARTMEPRAATPTRRLAAIEELVKAGIPCGVMAAPMIPALNDHELEAILDAAAARGATAAGYVMLRLPLEIKDLFAEWLEAHAPGRAKHVLSLVAQARGGKLYDAAWGRRMTGTGAHAELLRKRYDLACKRHGFSKDRWTLVTSLFRPPPRAGDQLALW